MPPAYQQSIEHCLSDSIGEHGLAPAAFDKLLADAGPVVDEIARGGSPEIQSLIRLTRDTVDLEALEPVAERYSESFDDVIVLGTGGSSLGGSTLAALIPPASQGIDLARPRLHFMDNIDPASFELLFSRITPARTGFLVISKSGATAETMCQFLYCLDVFRTALGEETANAYFTAITEPGDRPLRRLAEARGMTVLDHDPLVGGRFSALSLTGMLPAMIAGLDVEAVRAGAASVVASCDPASDPAGCPPAAGAAVNVGLFQSAGVHDAVLMPYVDRLTRFSQWYRQLWAESLGKDGQGTTPIAARGTVDQHSQLQLYLDGPRDKFFTLILSEMAASGGQVPEDLAYAAGLDFLSERRMGELMAAEQIATRDILISNGCPTRVIEIAGADEHTVGALMMHFILETIVAARLLGVNPFGQPAVEQGKLLAKKLLSEISSP